MAKTGRLSLVLCLALLGAGAGADDLPSGLSYGQVVYDAAGNLQLDEGTIELYLRVDFDSTRPFKDVYTHGPLVEIDMPQRRERAVVTYICRGARIAMTGYFKPLEHPMVVHVAKGREGVRWKPGEHHVVAFCWKGDRRQLFVDGVGGEDTKVLGPLPIDLEQAVIRVGGGCSLFAIDAIRISSVRRTAQELKAAVDHAPQADVYTLLLDHFDDTPAVLGGMPADQSRRSDGATVSVEGKFGRALQLWKAAAPAGRTP